MTDALVQALMLAGFGGMLAGALVAAVLRLATLGMADASPELTRAKVPELRK